MKKSYWIILVVAVVIAAVFLVRQVKTLPSPSSSGVPAAQTTGPVVSQEKLAEITGEAITQGINKDLCAVLGDPTQRAVCQMNVITAQAKDKGDVSLCNQIQDTGFKQNCQDQFYTYEAIVKKDAGICSKVQNDIRRAQCVGYVAQ